MSPSPAFVEFTNTTCEFAPHIAIVLGSGMSDMVDALDGIAVISFRDIPGMSSPSVAGHRGKLTLGKWAGKAVLVFEGRLHFYEGHPWEVVVRPVHVAQELGIRSMLFINAAGGINASLQPGSLMAIRDHIEWNRPYSWREPGPGSIGPEQPSPYCARLLTILQQSADDLGIELHQSIYASVTGPSYETPAEIRALQICGADAVGMSTAREVQTAHALGIECAGLSCITNAGAGLSSQPLSHGEVLATAAGQTRRLAQLVESFLMSE